VRSEYNFIEDNTPLSLLSSFFTAATHVELGNDRQSWFYLREAITLAQVLGLHTDEYYREMDYMSALYCRRTYILFITERSFVLARHQMALLPYSLPLATPETNDRLEGLQNNRELTSASASL
jgi:hypothetical protein